MKALQNTLIHSQPPSLNAGETWASSFCPLDWLAHVTVAQHHRDDPASRQPAGFPDRTCKVMFGEPAALQSPRQPLPEKQILLVEDEATSREILTYFLRGKGYVVDAVGSAGAAIMSRVGSLRTCYIGLAAPGRQRRRCRGRRSQRGAKTLIVSGLLFRLPGGAAMRHELLLKHLGPTQVLAAVQRAIGSPMAEAQVSDQATALPEETPKLPLAI